MPWRAPLRRVARPATRVSALLLCILAAAPATHAGEPGGQAEEAPAPPAEAGLKNTLKWTTASEKENLGYDVYRAESPEGPFQRISEKPVPGAGTTDETNKYEYVDAKIEPDVEYFYYVEAIAFDGKRVRFTPIIRAAPKGSSTKAADAPKRSTSEAVVGPDDGH